MMCDKVVVVSYLLLWGRQEAAEDRGARDTESKTRTPHKVMGKNKVLGIDFF
jgi:hypothetical protein